MRKAILIILLLLPLTAWAGNPPKHHLRLGWGDMLYESLVFPSASKAKGGNGYSGHLFAGYQYNLTPVVSVGGQLDYEAIRCSDMNNYDLVLMPTIRFTYLDSDWAELHSGMGVGILAAFDNQGGFEMAPAMDLNFVGVQLGQGPLRMGLDLGCMISLMNTHKIYLMGARLLSVSLNYSF